MTNLDSSKLTEFADNTLKFNEDGSKFIQMGRKHCGKRRNCSLRAISTFPTVFSKDLYCRHVKTRACLGKGRVTPVYGKMDNIIAPVFYTPSTASKNHNS